MAVKQFVNPTKTSWESILTRPSIERASLDATIAAVVANVESNGDKALIEYAQKFDGVALGNLLVSDQEIEEAKKLVNADLAKAIKKAYDNIYAFHKNQVLTEAPVENTPGVKCWRKNVAIDKVGLYIPGGTAPLFSTVLMLAIPANIAGCKEVVLCTPPNKEGKVHPAILYTANLCGVNKIVKAGGAQAIAALALGTESVPAVYKIFGPGNQYVTAAKQYVQKFGVAIDMPAGPSEVAVIADDTANAAFVASDLLSQAEHGADSQVVLFATTQAVVDAVQVEVALQLEALPRKEFAAKALENSTYIVQENSEELMQMVNAYAPEHLIINTKNYKELAEQVVNAGSVFLGAYTPESAGDYASGTNHTLPTNGYARNYSGVSYDSFIKKITFQEISKEGIKTLGPVIELMAAEEELQAHKNAVTLRLRD